MRVKTNFVFLICIILLSAGCSSYISYDVSLGYDDYMDTPKALNPEDDNAKGNIEITLVAPDKCACYLEKANQKKEISDDVVYQCLGFGVETEEPADEINEKMKADGAKGYQNYVFMSFDDVAKKCLEKQLEAYFSEVSINVRNVETGKSSNDYSVMSYYTKAMKTSDQYCFVKLVALSNNGKMLMGEGLASDQMGNGHLAWMIPLGVATFPIGFVIGSVIFNNNYNALVNRVIAEGIDIAAADLSKKIAAEMALNPNQHFEVFVMLE